jgi:hypothetical protein
LEIILEQNYYEFNKQFYKQTEGLTMGAPTSAILAEIYIHNIEHKQLYPVLLKRKIIGYFRYVDDILIIYNKKKTNIDETIAEFNKQGTNIRFSMEKRAI